MLKYLSPTSIATFMEDPEQFYLNYFVHEKREPQTLPMAAGSAFDAYVKCYLGSKFPVKGKLDLDSVFEQQVEPQNRDWARPVGQELMDFYKSSGGLADLMYELEGSFSTSMELDVMGFVGKETTVPLLGKPDLFFINREGAHVLIDWKVNGYCSNASPKAGYIRCRPGSAHRDSVIMRYKGIEINLAGQLDKNWKRQTTIYAWLCGENIGDEFVVGIDQLAWGKNKRCAAHRYKVEPEYQIELWGQIQKIWEIVNSDHFFRNMTLEQSQERCEILKNRDLTDDFRRVL